MNERANCAGSNQFEGVDMNSWSSEAMNIAEREITGIAQAQGSTGRTDSDMATLLGLITKMKSKELTPHKAIMNAREFADGRQDGHGGGSVQD